MEKYYEVLKTVELFDTMNETDLNSILNCLRKTTKKYKKNEIILLADNSISSVGIVLKGIVQITKEDCFGNRTIITSLAQGELFGEAYACAGVEKSPVTVIAETNAEILFLEIRQVFTTCSSACVFHTKLIENMLRVIAKKNMHLNNRLEILSARSTRDKIMAYFTSIVQKNDVQSFTIPFTRDEFADFICVNRSALSRELCKMRDEGILEFNKNEFTLCV